MKLCSMLMLAQIWQTFSGNKLKLDLDIIARELLLQVDKLFWIQLEACPLAGWLAGWPRLPVGHKRSPLENSQGVHMNGTSLFM